MCKFELKFKIMMNVSKFLVLLLLIFVSANTSFSQSENVTVIREKGIDDLVDKHIYYNEVMNSIPGYRIQIHSGSGNFSKNNAISERSRFSGRYPRLKAYIIFNTPYYIVRVGNFRTRLDAEAFRQLIQDHYPEAYIVRDDIDLPPAD
jgi:hypothetical protein